MTIEDDAAVDARQTAESAALDTAAALRAAIGPRISALRTAASVATTDQAKATTVAATETMTAVTVKASAPAVTVAYLTQIRDQLATIHTMLADLQTWRAQMDSGFALTATATADMATVVATKL